MEQRQSDEVRQWERDWRSSIQSQVSDTARTLSDVAGVVREMQSDVKDLMQWRNDEEKRKDARLDNQPDAMRAVFGTYGGCIGQALYFLVSLLSLGAAITALIITLTR